MDHQPAPEQAALALYEPAARIYCSMLGMNPDAAVKHPHPLLEGVAVSCPQWEIVAERMIDLSTLMVAMKRAKAANDAAPGHA